MSSDIQWQRGGKEHILKTYACLHENRLGAHWLWTAIERLVGGESEAEIMRDFGYVPDRQNGGGVVRRPEGEQ